MRKKSFLGPLKTVLLATLILFLNSTFFGCSTELDVHHSTSINAHEAVSFRQLYDKLKNPALRSFLGGALKNKLLENRRVDEDFLNFQKIEKTGQYTTYLLLTNEYSDEKPYIEYFIINTDSIDEEACFVRYLPLETYEVIDTKTIDPKTFSGKIEVKDIEENVVAESEFYEGLKLMAVSSFTCRNIIWVNVVNCSHSGQHGPGEECAEGYVNDAYYEITIQTICSQQYSIVAVPEAFINLSGGGSGGSPSQEQLEYNYFVSSLPDIQKNLIGANPLLKEFLLANILSEDARNFVTELLQVAVEDSIFEESSEKNLLVNILVQAYQNNSLDTINSNFINAIAPYFEPNVTDPILFPQYYAVHIAMIKVLHPEWSMMKVIWEASKDMVHLGLDLVGMAPLVGEVADISNGLIYLLEGEGIDASLSFASAIPIAGWGSTSAKFAYKFADNGAATLKFYKRNDGIITFGNRGMLRKILNLPKGDPRHAHHIIAWSATISQHEIVQKAASAGWHMSDATNGIAIAAWRNTNHPNYNARLLNRLNEIQIQYPSITPQQAAELLNQIASQIRTAINANPNSKLNDIIF